MFLLPTNILLSLLPFYLASNLPFAMTQASGSGTTTRYWDCCKPSCAWPNKASLLSTSTPVTTCDISDSPLSNANAVSGCDGGDSYMCSDQSPWAVSSDLAYGYAAVNIAGGSESSWCCACYELTFTSGPVEGKKMVVQATNTGGDLGSNQFDLAIPGGGVGLFNGCTEEWGAPSSGWGAQYGGISTDTCSSFPTALQPGCDWRFDWFSGADNPTVDFVQVECPAAITAKTGCVRSDDTSMPAVSGAAAASSVISSVSAVVASSSATSTVVPTSAVVSSAASSAVIESTSSTISSSTPSSTAVSLATSSKAGETSSLAYVESSSTPSVAATTFYTKPSKQSLSVAPKSTTTVYVDDDSCEL